MKGKFTNFMKSFCNSKAAVMSMVMMMVVFMNSFAFANAIDAPMIGVMGVALSIFRWVGAFALLGGVIGYFRNSENPDQQHKFVNLMIFGVIGIAGKTVMQVLLDATNAGITL